jgi:type IV secretory pathway VirB2 component (pilin)
MLKMLADLREFLAGKKTYLTAAVGIITATIAWSSGEITGLQFAQTLFVAIQTVFIRAGIAKLE